MVKLIEQEFAKNKELYKEIERLLREKIDKDIPIDHVGSTAIPNMIGKNIIDVLVGAKDKEQFQELTDLLSKMGYFPSKNSKNEIYQFFASREGETGAGDVHIHLVILNTDRYNEFLILRNYLLENKDEAMNYTNFKKEIINNISSERKEYRSVKSEYVTKLIERAKRSDDIKIIDLNPENIFNFGVCGYKDVEKHIELQNKISWFSEYYKKGLRIKTLISKMGGYQGMLEYIPGEYAFRPVNAHGYMFIHCLFVGFKNEFKGKGYATLLLKECIKEAKDAKLKGVAVVTRMGSFMAKKEIFLKLGFIIIDYIKPDFELLVLKFDENNENPTFINNDYELKKYSTGLTILRSVQCPYTEKNVKEIIETAEKKYKLKTKLVEIKTEKDAQKSPSAFGSFCLILNGKILAYAPISNTRFENIMKEIN